MFTMRPEEIADALDRVTANKPTPAMTAPASLARQRKLAKLLTVGTVGGLE
jgi:hypothetical protein